MPKNRYSITVKEIIYFVIYTKLLKLKNINTKKHTAGTVEYFKSERHSKRFLRTMLQKMLIFGPATGKLMCAKSSTQ